MEREKNKLVMLLSIETDKENFNRNEPILNELFRLVNEKKYNSIRISSYEY